MTRTTRRGGKLAAAALLALTALLLVLAGCGGSDSDAGGSADGGDGGGSGGELRVAVALEPPELDSLGTGLTMVPIQINEPLVRRDPSGELEPVLAKSLPKQVDATTWQVDLKDGISFTDGTPFDADAVVANFEHGASREDGLYQASVQGEPKATAVDKDTVRFRLQEPVPTFPVELQYVLLQQMDNPDLDEPIGTGPYVFDSWQRGQQIELSANPDYWGPKPVWEKVTFRFIPDEAARISALQAGEVDFITNVSSGSASQVPNLLSNPKSNLYYGFSANSRTGLFKDPRARQALSYAVDMNAISESIFEGRSTVSPCQAANSTYTGFNSELEPYPYDPQKAEQLLREAGADGASFGVLAVNGFFNSDAEFAQAVAGYWEEVGLKPDLQLYAQPKFVELLTNQEGERPDVEQIFSIVRDFDASNLWDTYVAAEGTSSSTTDPALDAEMKRAKAISDPAERTAAFQQPVKEICDEAYAIFGVSPASLFGARDGLTFANGSGPEAGEYLLRADEIVAG